MGARNEDVVRKLKTIRGKKIGGEIHLNSEQYNTTKKLITETKRQIRAMGVEPIMISKPHFEVGIDQFIIKFIGVKR